jgi:hypothetical protein
MDGIAGFFDSCAERCGLHWYSYGGVASFEGSVAG